MFYLPEANLNIKEVFVPDDTELYDMYDLDIASAEMRVLTAYSQDPTLIKVFNEGIDIHALTGSNENISLFSYEEILAKKEDKHSQEHLVRQVSKIVNFGCIYLVSPQGLQTQLHQELGLDVSEEVAAAYISGFLGTYPGVKNFMNMVKMFTKHFGFYYSLTGRRKRFPLMQYDRKGMNKMIRQAVNAPIQSTSSDLLLRNIINVNKLVKSLGGRLILTVHDSILFQLPKGITGVRAMLDKVITERTAQEFPWLPVPWTYDCKKGPSYGHCDTKLN